MKWGAVAPLALAAIALLLMLALPECPSAMTTTTFLNSAVATAPAEHHETPGCTAVDESVSLRSPTQHALIQHAADSGTDEVGPGDRPLDPHPATGVAVLREAIPPSGQTLLLLLSVLRN